MLRKSLASIVLAALLVAGPGHLTLTAAAQSMVRGATTRVNVIPMIGTGLNSPVPGASSLGLPTVVPSAFTSPSLLIAPSIVAPTPVVDAITVVAKPLTLAVVLPVGAKAVPTTAPSTHLSVIVDAEASAAEKVDASNAFFDNHRTGHEALEAFGQSAASVESGRPSNFKKVTTTNLPGRYVAKIDIEGPYLAVEFKVADGGIYTIRIGNMDHISPTFHGAWKLEGGVFKGTHLVPGLGPVSIEIDLSSADRNSIKNPRGVRVLVKSDQFGGESIPFRIAEIDKPFFPGE